MRDKRKSYTRRLLFKLKNTFQSSMLCGFFFLNWEKNSSSIKWSHRISGGLLYYQKCTDIDENQTPRPHHGFCDVHKRWWLYASILLPTWLRLITDTSFKSREEVVLTWIERVTAERSFVGQQDSVPRHTNRWTQCWPREKNFATTSPLTSGLLTPQIAIPLIRVGHCWVTDSHYSVQHKKWAESKDNGSIYQFKEGDHRKVYWRF